MPRLGLKTPLYPGESERSPDIRREVLAPGQAAIVSVMVQSFKPSWITIRRVLLLLAVLLVAGCGSPEERAQSYYEHGMKLLAQHDDAKASIEFRNALQLKKNMVGAWRALAGIAERNQNWDSLIGIRRTIVELDPKDVDAKVRLARLLFLAKGMDDALNVINAAGELDNRNASVLGLKAMILYKLDRKAAVRAAQAALEIEPANAEATVVVAADRFDLGDAEGALLILDREVGRSRNGYRYPVV